MIKLTAGKLKLPEVLKDLDALDKFLNDHDELEEKGTGSLQEFFTARPQLILLMGSAFSSGLRADAYSPEFSIFGEFRADYAITNKSRSRYLFVEFENAKANSIFRAKAESDTHVSYEWSPKFEHGFSQVVDWYFRLDDFQRTSKLEEHFGAKKIRFVGILVLGRDKFLSDAGLTQRFDWRREKSVINSQHLHCFTFDELAGELRGHYESLVEPDDH